MNMFFIAIFVMLQKNAFGQKKNSNFMHGFKSAVLEKMKKFPCYLLDFIKSKNTVSKMNRIYLAKDYEF